MSKRIVFPAGPRVCVTLECDDQGTLRKSILSRATEFTCTIVGKPNKLLEEALLTFLTQYAERTPSEIALSLSELSPFRVNVLHRLQKVPFGSTIAYGELALRAGHPGAARAVGTACHLNPFPLLIPCHRVIASRGKLGGFASDLELKKRLLAFEEN